MSEANQNTTSFDSESIWINQSEPSVYGAHNPTEHQNQETETVSNSVSKNNRLSSDHVANSVVSQTKKQTTTENPESLDQKMNWQRIAHKLREYNRKLLKKVFRLEQELAEIDNKFNKYVEKSQNRDLLLAHQAEEIKSHQENLALLTQQLASSEQQIDNQKLIIQRISEQHEFSQKQAAQLERECTSLQEKYNHQAFELVTKEQESQELQTQLNQQQQNTCQLEAELKKYQEADTSRKEKATSRHQNYPYNRYIQPWSTSTIPEPKIALPRNKLQPTKSRQSDVSTSETIKTAAQIATWSASTASNKKVDKSKTPKSSQSKKPQSLAAIDLPTFPRPQ
ncbi:MAG: hypothetical protein WBM44_27660 [Waterburya sp.]